MKKVTTKEFIWYAAAGILAFIGVVAIVFGIIGYHMSASAAYNFVQSFEEKIKIELRFVGLIFIAAGLVLAVIALLFNAKKADREIEKKIRREQRIAAQNSKTIEVKNAVEVIEEAPAIEPEEAK